MIIYGSYLGVCFETVSVSTLFSSYLSTNTLLSLRLLCQDLLRCRIWGRILGQDAIYLVRIHNMSYETHWQFQTKHWQLSEWPLIKSKSPLKMTPGTFLYWLHALQNWNTLSLTFSFQDRRQTCLILSLWGFRFIIVKSKGGNINQFNIKDYTTSWLNFRSWCILYNVKSNEHNLNYFHKYEIVPVFDRITLRQVCLNVVKFKVTVKFI